jgi:multicomponent Na+:H+ antiporter subunit A
MVLALAGLAAGVFWASAHFYFATPTASAVAGNAVVVTTGIVPKLNAALMLSILTIALGVVAYWKLNALRGTIARILNAIGWGPDQGFDQFVSAMITFAVGVTKATQSGKFDRYMTITFMALACALLLPMTLAGELPNWPVFPVARFYDWAMVLIAAVGILAVVFAKDRLTAIVSLGIQGFAVAVIYMLYGAPDLSFTQFMIETLSVVILALVMTKLNLTAEDHRRPASRYLDITIAAAVGIGFTLLLLKVLEGSLDKNLPDYFAEFSYTIAHGRNIVNVILVDFRGVDTLGEIGVVMIAGLAILALIRVRAKRDETAISERGGA